LAKTDDSRSSLLQSFNYAFDGIIHVVRTQRNMKIHVGLAIFVLVAAFFFNLDRLSIVALFVAISFVFITEMLNTALEYAIDIFTSRYDPLAKLTKDIAAGAVLVATMNALVVAYLVFYDRVTSVPYTVLSKVRQTPIDVAAITVFLLVVVVVAVKAVTGRGTALRGGLPSGHAAVAFGGWVAITFIASGTAFDLPISVIALVMAVLTAQSRVQAGIHTWLEVALGGLLGAGLTVLIFRLFYPLY
jgi:diacylglycerol kinase (ATP)